jgi:hypothetical protein
MTFKRVMIIAAHINSEQTCNESQRQVNKAGAYKFIL